MLRTLIAITMCQALSTCMYFLNGNFILLLSKSVNQHHAVQDASCPFSLIRDSEIFFFFFLVCTGSLLWYMERAFLLIVWRMGLVVPWHVESSFPDQGSNPQPLYWKGTEPLGKSCFKK